MSIPAFSFPHCFMDNLLQAASMALLQYPVINASIDVQVLSQSKGLIQRRIQAGGGAFEILHTRDRSL